MSFFCKSVVCVVAAAGSFGSMLTAQPVTPPAGSTGSSFTATVRPALAQVGEALNAINIRKWKAPNEVRSAAEEDVGSIQRDLTGTLAGLLQQSDANSGSVPAAFAVYRNVDALYDTLLRIVETAGLAAPENESATLDAALNQLESARSSLGDQIMNGSVAEQSEVVRLKAAIVAAATAAPRTARTTVVDDGPAPEPAHHHHTTTAKKKTTTPPGSEKPKTQQSQQPQQQ